MHIGEKGRGVGLDLSKTEALSGVGWEGEKKSKGQLRRCFSLEREGELTASGGETGGEGTLKASNRDTTTKLVDRRGDGGVREGDARRSVATVSSFVNVSGRLGGRGVVARDEDTGRS